MRKGTKIHLAAFCGLAVFAASPFLLGISNRAFIGPFWPLVGPPYAVAYATGQLINRYILGAGPNRWAPILSPPGILLFFCLYFALLLLPLRFVWRAKEDSRGGGSARAVVVQVFLAGLHVFLYFLWALPLWRA